MRCIPVAATSFTFVFCLDPSASQYVTTYIGLYHSTPHSATHFIYGKTQICGRSRQSAQFQCAQSEQCWPHCTWRGA